MDFEKLTCKEICTIFRVRENWVRDLEKLGLKTVEDKPVKRFKFTDLLEFIKTREVEKNVKKLLNKAIKEGNTNLEKTLTEKLINLSTEIKNK